MSLQVLSAPAFWLGLAGLAGVLFALQRLRVRHRDVQVPTLLFWREAVEEARARVFVERFRHPWAFLLVLAIAGLLWLALAGPRAAAERDGVRTTILLDASADMARSGRLAIASERARNLALELPRERRRVVVCGAEPRTLLAAGESAHLLRARLAGLRAEPAPPSIERALRAGLAEAGEQAFVLLSDTPLSEELRALVGERARLVQPRLDGALTRAHNAGVVALGIAAARSGDPTRVDALVAVVGTDAVALTLDGVPTAALEQVDNSPGGDDGAAVLRREFIARDVPAAGATLSAAVSGADALSLDDRAARALPTLTPVRVLLDPALAPAFRLALEVDASVRLVTAPQDADVVCLLEDSALGAGLPAFVLTSSARQEEPLLLTHDRSRASDVVLAQLVPLLGLDRVDARAIATAAGVPFAVGAAPGDERRLSLWIELFDEEGANLSQSRAFPALVARGVRWLARRPALVPELSAGRALPARASLRDENNTVLAAFGGLAVPPRAGEWIDAAGQVLPIALASVRASAPPELEEADTADPALKALAGGDVDWIAWLLAFCLALLGLEWVLVRSGRMP